MSIIGDKPGPENVKITPGEWAIGPASTNDNEGRPLFNVEADYVTVAAGMYLGDAYLLISSRQMLEVLRRFNALADAVREQRMDGGHLATAVMEIDHGFVRPLIDLAEGRVAQ